MATRMVCARSAAEIPVVTPSAASMDSVKAVPRRAVFLADIGGNARASQISGLSGRQMSPRACLAMKLMTSGVTFSAAMVRSPSFSRSSSSTITSILPARKSSMAAGIEEKGMPGNRIATGESRSQNSGARRQRAEGRRQKAGGRKQEAGRRRQEAEGRRQKAEGRRQKAEGRRQKAEGRRRKAGGGYQVCVSAGMVQYWRLYSVEAAVPFVVGIESLRFGWVGPAMAELGIQKDDELLQLEGRSYQGAAQLARLVATSRPEF